MFKQFEKIDHTNYIDPATLTNEQLTQGHNELMECPLNTYYWRELDEELNYRHEEHNLEWPY